MKLTLKALRVNKKMTQKEAAKRLGIALPTLQNYEAGKFWPIVPIIKKMEVEYGVKFDQIEWREK